MAANSLTNVDKWHALFPYLEKSLTVDHGVTIRFVDEGAGNPVLMLHGNPTWSFYYHELIRQLAPTHRCIAVDHIGSGRSDKPKAYPYCLDQHIANTIRLIDELDLRNATLVAHDWGGAIGLGALINRADRFSKIVLLNTAAFPPPFFPLRIRVCRTPLLGRLAVQGLNVFARAAIRMATNRHGGLPPEVIAGLLAPYNSWSNRVAIYEFVRDIPVSRQQPAWRRLAEIEAQLPQLKQRKLLVWGMRDWCFRAECLERFQTHWPDAKVVRLGDAGHYVLLDEPETVVKSVSGFLNA